MIRKIIVAIFLIFASLVVADAQSDGTYRGKVRLTKDVEHISGADRCVATGTGIEFRVTGATISVTYRPGQAFAGPLTEKGNFEISGTHPAGQPGKWISSQWKGTLKGSQIAGNSSGRSPGRDCYHSFAAKKVGGT